jgi:hypothetical protein
MTSKPHGTVNNVPGTYTRGSPVLRLEWNRQGADDRRRARTWVGVLLEGLAEGDAEREGNAGRDERRGKPKKTASTWARSRAGVHPGRTVHLVQGA